MWNTAIDSFEKSGGVAPWNLKKGLFVTAAGDNIDRNPSSSTATTSLHGTAASIHQHVKSDNPGSEREVPTVLSTEKKLKSLPTEYSEVPPTYLPKDVEIGHYDPFDPHEVTPELQTVVSEEQLWLDNENKVSWAEFHGERQRLAEGERLCSDISAY